MSERFNSIWDTLNVHPDWNNRVCDRTVVN